ncbi:ATP-binding protein [Tissierella sp. MSJ-40]|uniref:ATP-binding protein n=1 Tax=Tissierella simiarum TaxID=2841534 RepID=A0ABS6EB44_9FIRM|nr:ATP-binding protein [Tissierella simiarum]MBU5439984.1 ATP-binding protein [Tissierella simiarum]
MAFKYSGSICSDLDKIRVFIDEILDKLNSIIKDQDTMFDLKLILNELVINGVFHGNECNNNKCVRLYLEVIDNIVRIEVEDEGKGIDYDISSYNSAELKCCGRGLIIVNGLSDEFYVKKNKVIAVKRIN